MAHQLRRCGRRRRISARRRRGGIRLASDDAPRDGGLRNSLKNRHIQLIALGGAIGTGLFYGSSDSISLAGPSILLAYAIGGFIMFMIVRALSEMSVEICALARSATTLPATLVLPRWVRVGLELLV